MRRDLLDFKAEYVHELLPLEHLRLAIEVCENLFENAVLVLCVRESVHYAACGSIRFSERPLHLLEERVQQCGVVVVVGTLIRSDKRARRESHLLLKVIRSVAQRRDMPRLRSRHTCTCEVRRIRELRVVKDPIA